MSLNHLLGNNLPNSGFKQTTKVSTAANRLIIVGSKSNLMDELMKLVPNRSEDSLQINWMPADGIDEHKIDTIARLRAVDLLDIVVVNSCTPDCVTGERELRAIYSDIRTSMKAVSSRETARITCRWWMCVELSGAAPNVISMWQNAGRLVFRHAAESQELVGTLVLLGDSVKGAAALREVLDDECTPTKRVLDFVSNDSRSLDLARSVYTSASNLPEEKQLLVSEMEMVRCSLLDLNSELRETHEVVTSSNSELATTRAELEQVGLNVAVQTHELFTIETEISAHRGQIAIMVDQADSLRREIDYLLTHHSSLTDNLNAERASLRTLREETAMQIARNEQIQSSLTRAEVDASRQRVIAAEANHSADKAQSRLKKTLTAIAKSRKSLAEVVSEIENRKEEILDLDRRRAERASEVAEFETTLASRLQLLEHEIATTQTLRHEVTLMLEKAQSERTAVQSELAQLTGDTSNTQLEASRISRDHLAIELAHLEAQKVTATTRIEELGSQFREMNDFVDDVNNRRNELELTVSSLEKHASDLEIKRTNAQNEVDLLSKTADSYEIQINELRLIQDEIDVQRVEIEEHRANIDLEVSERVTQRLLDLLSLRPRARRRAIKAALIHLTAQLPSSEIAQ
jgi:chromosome segregation ATPase